MSATRATLSVPKPRVAARAMDCEMRMPGATLAGEPPSLERRLQLGLERADLERALGDTHPEDARALDPWEGAQPVKREGERRVSGTSLLQPEDGLGEPRVGLLGEELERQMQVRGGYPGHGSTQ